MSKEQDFHKLIEQQDIESKEKLWERIQSESEVSDNVVQETDGTVALVKSRILNIKKVAILCAVFLLAVALIVTVVLLSQKKQNSFDIRYCDEDDYYIEVSDIPLNEYASQNGLSILVFNGQEVEYFECKLYKLNDTDEVICYYEESINADEAYLQFYVAKENIDMDIFSLFKDYCTEDKTVGAIDIKWDYSMTDVYTMFNYKGYNYYLKAEEITDPDYVLNLIEDLLNQ